MNITISIVCIGISWWALQSFRFDLFVKNPKGAQAKLLQILLAIVIGHGVSTFFFDYLGHSLLLNQLFQ
ncbi:DUF1146 family protein [Brevibacillus daliensis]|uniref:DUF1146 family protein n=1 Tax=Brevibacillus daliensis TaxID=2892995 RepID=UPI001E292520|nr:DUF1146 family protein [Brevibacillus daliensis]